MYCVLAELVQQDSNGQETSTGRKGISRSCSAEKRKEETGKGLKNGSEGEKEKEVNVWAVVFFCSEHQN